MLEFIGFIALCFIFYKILKKIFIKKRQFDSIKSYVTAESLAINELNIPRIYFNYIISENIDEIKEIALDIKDDFPNASWEAIMAFTVYTYFYDDFFDEHPILDDISLDAKKLDNPDNIKKYFINSKSSYLNYTNYEIEELIIEASKIKSREITHHPSLAKRIIKYTEDKKYFLDYFNNGMGFFAKDIDHKNEYTVFIKPVVENEISPLKLNVGKIPK